MAEMKKYDLSTLGEILIDFTGSGRDEYGMRLFAQNAGGAVANACVCVQKLGCRTAFIGKVGDDMHGQFLIDTFRDAGVDTTYITVDPEHFTTLAFVALGDNGERKFSFARKQSADIMLSKEDLPEDIISNSTIFHIGSLSLCAEPAKTATYYALDLAKKSGAIITYDPNYRDTLWPDEETACEMMKSLVPYADFMKLSDEETMLLTGVEDPEGAAAILAERGVQIVAVTLGSKGAYMYYKGEGAYVPGFASKPVDTTGAGDSFTGGFLYRMITSGKKPDEFTMDEIIEFATYANATASICVEKKGGIPAMPTPEQVEERLKRG